MLDIYILTSGNFEKRNPYFTEVTEEYDKESNKNNAKQKLTISNLKEKTIKKGLNIKKNRCIDCITCNDLSILMFVYA